MKHRCFVKRGLGSLSHLCPFHSFSWAFVTKGAVVNPAMDHAGWKHSNLHENGTGILHLYNLLSSPLFPAPTRKGVTKKNIVKTHIFISSIKRYLGNATMKGGSSILGLFWPTLCSLSLFSRGSKTLEPWVLAGEKTTEKLVKFPTPTFDDAFPVSVFFVVWKLVFPTTCLEFIIADGQTPVIFPVDNGIKSSHDLQTFDTSELFKSFWRQFYFGVQQGTGKPARHDNLDWSWVGARPKRHCAVLRDFLPDVQTRVQILWMMCCDFCLIKQHQKAMFFVSHVFLRKKRVNWTLIH